MDQPRNDDSRKDTPEIGGPAPTDAADHRAERVVGAPGAFPERIAHFLVRWRWVLLSVGIVTAVIAWFPAQRLSFDRAIDTFFAPDDPLLGPYRKLQRTFGGNEVALAAYDDEHLLTTEGMARLERLTAALEKVPGVRSVFSLTRSPLFGARIMSWPVASQREAFFKLSEGYTVSADRRTAGVVCVLNPEETSQVSRDETIAQMRQAIDTITPGGVLAGEPVMVVDGFRYLEQDGRRLGIAATTLLSLTIVLCFRSLRWVLVPMTVVFSTLIITEGTLASSGFRLSMVSSMLWAIIAVVGIATVTHVVISFRELRTTGLSAVDAARSTFAAQAGPVFWACMTDTVGFGSLMISRVGPVHDFGAMMSLGAVMSLACIALFVPGLTLLGPFDIDPKRAWGERHLDFGLHRLSDFIERHPWLLTAIVLVTAVPPLFGSLFLEVESDFTKNFRRDSPIVQAYDFVETRLGGAGVWDVIVPVSPDGGTGFVPQMRRLEDRLRSEVRAHTEDSTASEPGLTSVMSAIDAIDAFLGAPTIDAKNLEATLAPLKGQMPIVGLLHGRDPADGNREYMRIMLRSRERQSSAQKEDLIQQVTAIVHEEFPEAEVTGFFVLLTRLIESTLRDQWLTFIISTTGIFLMMLVAFRSVPIALVTLVPNALPIMVVTGLMGWAGLKINMGAAMIAAVSMGLAVDSSAHYITAFRAFRAAGLSVDEALRSVHQSVGRAVAFATLSLIVGFSALCLSEFVPTIYFGVLVSLAMLGGMAGNLVILPLLLKVVCWFQQPTEPSP